MAEPSVVRDEERHRYEAWSGDVEYEEHVRRPGATR